MSERAVEIERMTVKLETLFIEGGNLSYSYFIRIQQALEQVERMQTASPKERNEWWHNLQEDFKRLNQNYQDYLREFYTGRSEKILKSVEFLLHKDRFITYLQEFIQQLRVNTVRIERQLRGINEDAERELLEKVIAGELEIPHAALELHEPMEQYIRENIYGKWEALKRWFLPTATGGQSESSRVLDITDEIIRKIIQNAALIVQLQNWGISRKDDYKKFISLFLDCSDVEEAHKLSAHLFGIQHIRHFKVNGDRSTDSINSSVYEEEPMEYSLKPRTRNYRPRIDKTGFEDRYMEKLARRNVYLEQVEQERKMVMRFIKDNCLKIADIDEIITSAARETLLRWITAANLTKSKTGRTEFGQTYRLRRTEETCVLHCEDGDLTMPAYIFEFMEEQDGNSTNLDGTLLDQ